MSAKLLPFAGSPSHLSPAHLWVPILLNSCTYWAVKLFNLCLNRVPMLLYPGHAGPPFHLTLTHCWVPVYLNLANEVFTCCLVTLVHAGYPRCLTLAHLPLQVSLDHAGFPCLTLANCWAPMYITLVHTVLSCCLTLAHCWVSMNLTLGHTGLF